MNVYSGVDAASETCGGDGWGGNRDALETAAAGKWGGRKVAAGRRKESGE